MAKTSIAISNAAQELGHLFDTEANEQLTTYLAAKDTVGIGCVPIAATFFRLFDIDQISSMPVPSSEEKDVSGNQMPDKYEAVETVNGTTRTVKRSYYKDFFLATAKGKQLRDLIIEQETKDHSEYITDDRQRDSITAKYRQSVTNGVALVRKAASVVQQIIAINENLDSVAVRLFTVPEPRKGEWAVKMPSNMDGALPWLKDQYLVNTSKPFHMGTIDEGGKTFTSAVSVGTFLAYDVEQAVKDGGTLAALQATAKRGKKEDDVTKESSIKNFEGLIDTMTNLLLFFDAIEEEGKSAMDKFDAKLLQFASHKELGDSHVEMIGDVCLAMDNVYTVIRQRYNTIKERKAATLQTQAA